LFTLVFNLMVVVYILIIIIIIQTNMNVGMNSEIEFFFFGTSLYSIKLTVSNSFTLLLIIIQNVE